jgi:hypothetical protein
MTNNRDIPANTSEFVAMINSRVFPNSPEFRMRLKTSLVNAFIGKIDSKIRGIQMSYENTNDTKINCYIDSDLTEEEREDLSEVEDEIVCDFCTPYNEIRYMDRDYQDRFTKFSASRLFSIKRVVLHKERTLIYLLAY